MKFISHPPKKKANTTASRGFVLSFAVLTLSLFILIYAQIQSDHLFNLHLQESNLDQRTLPLRFALDARADLNQLLDERVRVDQNATHSETWISASLPSPLSLSTVLSRYQTNLFSLARDANLSILLDLNASNADGNVTGRLSNGLVWKRNYSTSIAVAAPTSALFVPRQYDININASLPYTSTSAWSLEESGNVFINLRYTDQNTAHATTSSGWITASSTAKQYRWTFGTGSAVLILHAGNYNRVAGSVVIDNNNTSLLSAEYSIRILQDVNGSMPTRAGYDLPLSVVGADGNFVAATQWLTN